MALSTHYHAVCNARMGSLAACTSRQALPGEAAGRECGQGARERMGHACSGAGSGSLLSSHMDWLLNSWRGTFCPPIPSKCAEQLAVRQHSNGRLTAVSLWKACRRDSHGPPRWLCQRQRCRGLTGLLAARWRPVQAAWALAAARPAQLRLLLPGLRRCQGGRLLAAAFALAAAKGNLVATVRLAAVRFLAAASAAALAAAPLPLGAAGRRLLPPLGGPGWRAARQVNVNHPALGARLAPG